MPEASKRDCPHPHHETQENLRIRSVDISALAALLNQWMHGDAAEQRDTFENLRRLLNENRPAGYKLFP